MTTLNEILRISSFDALTQLTQRIAYDGSGAPQYVGLAVPGTSVNAAAWHIRKMVMDGSGNIIEVIYADGNANFDNIWADRALLTYS